MIADDREQREIEAVARAIFRGEKGRDAEDDFWLFDCTGAFAYRSMARASIAALDKVRQG